jgi:hypothetical protein
MLVRGDFQVEVGVKLYRRLFGQSVSRTTVVGKFLADRLLDFGWLL